MHNIAIVHEFHEIAGAENSLLYLARNIDRNRFNLIFVLPRQGQFWEELKKIGTDVDFCEFPKIRGLHGVGKALRFLSDFVKKKNISLIHSNSIRTHIYSTIAARRNRIPVIWHQRNLLIHELIDPDSLLSFLPDKIICNSYAVARRFSILRFLPKKVTVIYNGVDTNRFRPDITGEIVRKEFDIRPSEAVIGIASRFHENKNHETFLKAVRIICSRHRGPDSLKFLIVGASVFEEDRGRELYLRDFVRLQGIQDKVIFTGFRKDMPEAYAAMDILVISSFREACGRVIIEAMSSGKPVIGSNTGGNRELIVDAKTGILFSASDPKALAEAISYLVQHKDVARAMGETGRKRVEQYFDIRVNVKKTEAVYGELLGRI
ncbi:MAG: glycosyltransferase family 1 protein [Candidatus Omnitrophota bacterium]|nr:MAG: glycosyltransferase family 1 protein [Candidatus Omnitrophota bacterium]